MRTLQTLIKSCALLIPAFALVLCVGCSRVVKHCYLCEGIPRGAPCVVDLATGDIAELSTDSNNGAMSWQFIGSLHVTHTPGTASVAIPAETQSVNKELFCDDCLAVINAVSNNGYILADLSDLQNIQVYPIMDNMCCRIRDYSVLIDGLDDIDSLHIRVQNLK